MNETMDDKAQCHKAVVGRELKAVLLNESLVFQCALNIISSTPDLCNRRVELMLRE